MVNSRHQNYSEMPSICLAPSRKDFAQIARVQADAYEHTSYGTFNMLALWVKGSVFAYGYNYLKRPANKINNAYGTICGLHAELDLYRKYNIKGGTVFIA